METTIQQRAYSLRKRDKLTQQQVADKAGVSGPSISNFESTGQASDETIAAYCKLFKVKEDWFRTGVGEQPKGLIIIPLKKESSESIWKEEAYKTLKEENQRLWRLIEKISGAPAGSIANFLKSSIGAGAQGESRPAQMEVRRA